MNNFVDIKRLVSDDVYFLKGYRNPHVDSHTDIQIIVSSNMYIYEMYATYHDPVIVKQSCRVNVVDQTESHFNQS